MKFEKTNRVIAGTIFGLASFAVANGAAVASNVCEPRILSIGGVEIDGYNPDVNLRAGRWRSLIIRGCLDGGDFALKITTDSTSHEEGGQVAFKKRLRGQSWGCKDVGYSRENGEKASSAEAYGVGDDECRLTIGIMAESQTTCADISMNGELIATIDGYNTSEGKEQGCI
jgi:hypothetical protein